MIIQCHVQDGSLIHQPLPEIEGVEWRELKEFRQFAGNFISTVYEAQVEVLPDNLPNNCWVVEEEE